MVDRKKVTNKNKWCKLKAFKKQKMLLGYQRKNREFY